MIDNQKNIKTKMLVLISVQQFSKCGSETPRSPEGTARSKLLS